jgi:hypothetical protein
MGDEEYANVLNLINAKRAKIEEFIRENTPQLVEPAIDYMSQDEKTENKAVVEEEEALALPEDPSIRVAVEEIGRALSKEEEAKLEANEKFIEEIKEIIKFFKGEKKEKESQVKKIINELNLDQINPDTLSKTRKLLDELKNPDNKGELDIKAEMYFCYALLRAKFTPKTSRLIKG